jgi:Na+/melibiose symporter-like transporter
LERANGQLGAVMTVSQQMVGPAAGGATFSLAAAVPFAADAVSFLASSALIAGIRGRFHPEAGPGPRRRRSLRAEIGEGLRWLASHRLLRALAVLVGVVNLVFMAGESILVLFAQRKLGLGSIGFGLLLTAFALGGVPGSLVAARVSSRMPAAVVVIGGLVAWAVTLVAFGLSSNPWVAGLTWAISGLVSALWQVVGISLRQSIVPDRLMGRVVSAFRLLAFGTIPLGAVLGGMLGRTLSLRAPYLLGAAALAATALAVAPVINTHSIEAARAAAAETR